MKSLKIIVILTLTMSPLAAQDAGLIGGGSGSTFSGGADAGNSSIVSGDFEITRFSLKDKPLRVTMSSVAFDSFQPVGKIVGSFRNVKYLTNLDTVYLSLKNPAVSKGDVFTIYANGGKIKTPGKTFSGKGVKAEIKGFVEILKVENSTIVGKIFNATTDISQSDLIGPDLELRKNYNPQEPSGTIEGKILSSASEGHLIGSFEFVFLDKGLKDGLHVNDKLLVYRTSDGSAEIKEDVPKVNIAEIVVIHADQTVATAYVVASMDSFEGGAPFRSAHDSVRYLDQSVVPSANLEKK